MSYIVYILENKQGAMYIGITNNLHKRLQEHVGGRCATTLKMQPKTLKLRHSYTTPSFSLASRFERYLHTLTKSQVLDIILDCPNWCSLLEKEAESKILQYSEKLIDEGARHKFYKNTLVSLPSKDQLTGVK